MNAAPDPFDLLLQRLSDARLADEDTLRRGASLEERTASHDVLVRLRSEVAMFRTDHGLEPINVSGLHDSRTRRGIDLD